MAEDTKTLETLLFQLGFSKNEAEVYLGVQKHGKITPAQLAEVTGINRTTVYSLAKELIKRGVIAEDLGQKQRFLIASSADSLAGTVRRKQKELDKEKDVVNQAMAAVQDISRQAQYAVPKIQFITEEKLEDFLYSRSPEWDRSIMETDGLYLGFQEQALAEQYADWIEWYWGRSPKGMKFNLLSNDSEAEKRVAMSTIPDRKMTFWKENIKFSATTWVMGEYVVMFVLSSSPQYLVEIKDARFAENQRALFKAILEELIVKQNK
ncbi:hypothetical protein COV06_03405 [Candidatus Uhrbacteria bacterium CG10_big_fil_rev_8_21_14_0_10_50_16]|uniref:Transcription regulator TrmB N-terminal domain-containing protein n=1 Tax=Candidatus Uhrbacteria bacterium CG10_big_fil_rev_8_21_14_0_10_50_16 TaxID=1975039 RepID=A0A2H0RM15_9BACT|nr:MAG: hypothetical protein COV06_03405 [Candidatus Uhrbacteria bacterium CG10_big_fil_rev_8_21_14_0_10_50_16]